VRWLRGFPKGSVVIYFENMSRAGRQSTRCGGERDIPVSKCGRSEHVAAARRSCCVCVSQPWPGIHRHFRVQIFQRFEGCQFLVILFAQSQNASNAHADPRVLDTDMAIWSCKQYAGIIIPACVALLYDWHVQPVDCCCSYSSGLEALFAHASLSPSSRT